MVPARLERDLVAAKPRRGTVDPGRPLSMLQSIPEKRSGSPRVAKRTARSVCALDNTLTPMRPDSRMCVMRAPDCPAPETPWAG